MTEPVTASIDVGAARITAVLDTEGPFFASLRDAFPDAHDDAWGAARRIDPTSVREPDTWWLAFRAYVVEVGSLVVLVDTGAASDTPARSSWAPRGPHLAPRLQDTLGRSADEVTHVVLTHLHGDHTAGSVDAEGRPAFAQAEYVAPAADVAAVESSDAPLRTALVEPLRRSGRLHACSGALELTGGETRVSVIPTPGHTPGHQSVTVEHGHRSAFLAGDVVLHAVQLVDPATRYLHDDDHETAARSRRELLGRWRSTGGVLGTAHLGVPWVAAEASTASS